MVRESKQALNPGSESERKEEGERGCDGMRDGLDGIDVHKQ